jgi:hypothetical protein
MHGPACIFCANLTPFSRKVDAADEAPCRPDFSIFQYPWMLLPGNKVPTWGAAYTLADELAGMSKDHPPSAFIQNIDDTTAPPQVKSAMPTLLEPPCSLYTAY